MCCVCDVICVVCVCGDGGWWWEEEEVWEATRVRSVLKTRTQPEEWLGKNSW